MSDNPQHGWNELFLQRLDEIRLDVRDIKDTIGTHDERLRQAEADITFWRKTVKAIGGVMAVLGIDKILDLVRHLLKP